MDIANLQVQNSSSTATTSTTNTTPVLTNNTNSETNSGTFVEMLITVIEGQTTGEQVESSEDAAASLIVNTILPSSIVNLMVTNPASEDLETTIQSLNQVIQTMNTEQQNSVLDEPDLQLMMAKANQTINQDMNSSKLVMANTTEVVASTSQLESTELDSTKLALATASSTNSATPLSVQNTQTVVTDPNESTAKTLQSTPVLSAAASNTVEASKVEVNKVDKSSSTTISYLNLSQHSTSAQTSGDMFNEQQKGSQSQLLQRLAFISPTIIHSNETPIVQDAASQLTDSSVTVQDDVSLPQTQNTDSAKLTTSTEVKPAAAPTAPSVPVQDFSEEMTRLLVKNMSITQLNGSSEAKISLVPEHLGQVDIKISIVNGQITAHFMAESAHARDLLELQLPQLRAALQQQGLQVDKLNVEQYSNLNSNLFQEQRHQHNSQQFAQNGKNNANDYDKLNNDFSLEMDQEVRVNRLAYGNTFNATA